MMRNDPLKILEFGEVILLSFPFSDGTHKKKRPALVLKDLKDGDIIVSRITSQQYSSDFDLEISDWKNCGLKLPSVIRFHKIATLEKTLVYKVLGQIDEQLIKNSHNILQSLFI